MARARTRRGWGISSSSSRRRMRKASGLSSRQYKKTTKLYRSGKRHGAQGTKYKPRKTPYRPRKSRGWFF